MKPLLIVATARVPSEEAPTPRQFPVICDVHVAPLSVLV
jgi:hypothetical protein